MIRWWSTMFNGIRHRAERSPLLQWSISLLTVVAILGLGGLLVATAGIIPIKASSGHWDVTTWLLQFAKDRSVSTHTIGIQPPPLDKSWLVLKGAGHYETACRACHGSPGYEHPKIASHMLPAPPYLLQSGSKWQPEELFYMVKHGIKFTGMPAWPSAYRDDEVWAVVAFLQAFPQMDEVKYRQLVYREMRPSQEVTSPTAPELDNASAIAAKSCSRCHGPDGLGRELAAFPKLAGLPADYIAATLNAYASGERHSGMMEPIAAELSSTQIRVLSQHYAGLKSQSPGTIEQSDVIERGRVIAENGIPAQDVPACVDCHGSTDAPMNLYYPSLAGQFADYLELQLTLFKQQQRGGSTHAHLMRPVVDGLTAEQMRDVAQFYTSLRLKRKAPPPKEP